jgi:hypothetical protein
MSLCVDSRPLALRRLHGTMAAIRVGQRALSDRFDTQFTL